MELARVAATARLRAEWVGVWVKPLHPLYDYAWFVGFGAPHL